MSAAVIIPYGGDDPYRHRNLQHVLGFYQDVFPSSLLVRVATNDGAFHKARAVNQAVAALPAHVRTLILNDADSLCYPSAILRALELADRDDGIVFAFDIYQRLTKGFTVAAWDWRKALYGSLGEIEWELEGSGSHGCLAMSLPTFITAGGLDEAYEGWGYEDFAFNTAAEKLWPTRRVGGPLIHLWHPAAPENPLNAERYYKSRFDGA